MKAYLKKSIALIVLMLASCLVLAFLFAYGFYISAGVMLALIAGEVYYLLRHMENNSRTLMQFIWSVRYTDFLTSYASGKRQDGISPELAEAMEDAIREYKKQLQEKESQLQYFQALANHIDLSILVFSPDGTIEWMNYAAQILSGLKAPRTIDDLLSFHAELPARLRALRPGDMSILQVTHGRETFQLALSGMSFVVLGRPLTVVSMKNIRTALDNKETEAWQKLIHVLTHEIMNSMTPIVSLSGLVTDKLVNGDTLSQEDLKDVSKAIETISRRSAGLLGFVDNYRKVTGIPSPVLQVVGVNEIMHEVAGLFNGTSKPDIKLSPVHLQLIADKNQIVQVLINLIKNALEATEEMSEARVEVSSGVDTNGHTFLQVNDNGPGISPDVLDRIFIPFFTTKTSGSGIGLSISRQIMHMHRGSLTVNSAVGKGSHFILTFY